MSKYEEGTQVVWNWGDGEAEGKITAVYTARVTKEIKGTSVVRDADEQNPAYLIEQADGDRVLKSHSELQKA